MKKLLVLLFVLCVFACGKRVEIEQETNINASCRYDIETCVWVLDGWYLPDHNLIYRVRRWSIHKDTLEAVQQREYEYAQIVADRVRECLGEEKNKKNP